MTKSAFLSLHPAGRDFPQSQKDNEGALYFEHLDIECYRGKHVRPSLFMRACMRYTVTNTPRTGERVILHVAL